MTVDWPSSPPPAPVTQAAPGEATYAAIRRAILDGTLRPGERIVEQPLAQTLGVSRTPVREALLKLERDNLIVRVGRGMEVRRYSSDEIQDIYSLRAHLESYGARLAAGRINDGELAALSSIQDELAPGRSNLPGEAFRALARHNQFHALLVRYARSEPLNRCFVQVCQLPLLYLAYAHFDDERRLRSDREHRELIRLLRAGDGPAAEAHWRSHLQRGGDELAQHVAVSETSEF